MGRVSNKFYALRSNSKISQGILPKEKKCILFAVIHEFFFFFFSFVHFTPEFNTRNPVSYIYNVKNLLTDNFHVHVFPLQKEQDIKKNPHTQSTFTFGGLSFSYTHTHKELS